MNTFGKNLGFNSPKKLPVSTVPTELLHLPYDDTFVGVELEIESINIDRLMASTNMAWFEKAFIIERDTSLRNNGQEIITRKGTTLHGALCNIFHIYTLGKKLNKEFGDFTISPRCSVHVHWNILDKTEEELKKILLLYMAVEKAMFAVSGNRAHNIFCVPLLSRIPFNLTERFLNPHWTLVHHSEGRRSMLNIDWGKYSALNLLPIVNQGTIEFRHHAGTVDYAEIQNWLYTIKNLVDFSSRFKTAEELYKWLQATVQSSTYDALLPIFVSTNKSYVTRPVDFSPQLVALIKESVNKTVTLCACNTPINPEEFLPETPKGTVKKEKLKIQEPPPIPRPIRVGQRRPEVPIGEVEWNIALNRAREVLMENAFNEPAQPIVHRAPQLRRR